MLLDLLVEPACDLRTAGGTKLATGWGAGRAPGAATPGAASCMLNTGGCWWWEEVGNGAPVLKPKPIKGAGMEP